jgi:hypothetical protein
MSTYLTETAYNAALELVACGVDRSASSDILAERYPLSIAQLDSVLADALDGALSCGIEREDIDESWF